MCGANKPLFRSPDTEGVILSEARPRFRFAPSPSAQVRLRFTPLRMTHGGALRFVRSEPKPSPVGKVPRNEADEVLEICTAKTADTSSVLPYGNPPSPRGKAYKKAKTPRRGGMLASHPSLPPRGRWRRKATEGECVNFKLSQTLFCSQAPPPVSDGSPLSEGA